MTKKSFLYAGILIGAVGITWALKAQQKVPEKKYRVEQSLEWWSHALQAIEAVKTNLKLSDLPSKNVVFLSDSLLTPIQMEITKQVQDQLASEQRRDTSKPKK